MKTLLIILLVVCILSLIILMLKSSTNEDVNRVGSSFALGFIVALLVLVLSYKLYYDESNGKFSTECSNYYADTTTIITPYDTTQTYKIYYYKSDK